MTLACTARNLCSYSVVKWHAVARAFSVVDCVREMTAKKSCKYREYGLHEYLLHVQNPITDLENMLTSPATPSSAPPSSRTAVIFQNPFWDKQGAVWAGSDVGGAMMGGLLSSLNSGGWAQFIRKFDYMLLSSSCESIAQKLNMQNQLHSLIFVS